MLRSDINKLLYNYSDNNAMSYAIFGNIVTSREVYYFQVGCIPS